MVVTGRAMIVGNEVAAEVESEKLLGAQVSFIGQVPVIVEGPCSQGDLIPTEGNICKAVPQDIVTFEQYRSAVGTALEASREKELLLL